MIYLQLFWVYLKIGLLGFGGGYAMLSMIQFEVVEKHAWMTMSEFADVVALSQMTPGPISINCATYVGYQVGGIFGSLLASFSIVLPSLILLYFVLRYLFKHKDNFIIKTTLRDLKPFIAGLIFAAAMLMMNKTTFSDFGIGENNISVIICAVTFVAIFFFKVNPMIMIAISGVAGLAFF
ncbi:MAG: chromate transporter [Lentimicrobiaceae bacterium]|nr:chromate transporter [Lentimicrobiaceae bacterium]